MPRTDTGLDPIAKDLNAVNEWIDDLNASLAEAKRRRTELREEINSKIVTLIKGDKTLTNVELAARFGMKSETSVRNIRKSAALMADNPDDQE